MTQGPTGVSSNDVNCDSCGRLGRRRAGYPCPDHWLFLVSTDAGDGTLYIVWACSETCRDRLWQPGPGPTGLIEDSAASQAALYRQRRDHDDQCQRVPRVRSEDLAFLREVIVEMTAALVDEAAPAAGLEQYHDHRARRERLLKILLTVAGGGTPS